MNPLNYIRLHDLLGGNPRQYWGNASNGKIRMVSSRDGMFVMVKL